MTQQKININDFNAQQLYQLRQGFESQINTYSQSFNQLRYAQEKYQQGKRAIKAAQDCHPQQNMLIPLSNALYIQGTLDNLKDNKRVYMIEYGAGFFVQRSAQQAIEFYQRKVNQIKERSVKLSNIINDKKQQARMIQMRIMALVQQAQAQQQQTAK